MVNLRPLIPALLAPFIALTAADAGAPSPEPTADETMILELINRFRADPAGEATRIAPEGGATSGIPANVDLAMFRREMQALKSAPPLVMNLALLAAARKHSQYMILHGLGHDEDAAKPGFTGTSFSDRVKAEGYRGSGGGENCFRDARDPWHSQVGFLVDWGAGGDGGMQAGRGHRTNEANGGFREIGPGAVAHDGRLSVTHNFGMRGVPRLAGGVVYVDLDRDGFYTPGEGRGGVTITASDGSKAMTWASGAYTLELTSNKPVVLVAEASGRRVDATQPAGSDNVKFDWIIPQEVDLAAADKLLAEVDKAKDAARFKAVVALHLGAARLCLDRERKDRVTALTGDVGTQLTAAQQAVRTALGSADFRKIANEQAKPYRATAAAAWFRHAEILNAAQATVTGFEQQAATKAPPAKQVRDLLAQLEQARDAMDDGDLRARVQSLIGKVQGATKS